MLFAPKKPVEAAPANKVELHPEYRGFSVKINDTEIHKAWDAIPSTIRRRAWS